MKTQPLFQRHSPAPHPATSPLTHPAERVSAVAVHAELNPLFDAEFNHFTCHLQRRLLAPALNTFTITAQM